MADLYDDQFRQRLTMHLMVSDQPSGEIISAMQRYLDRERKENSRLRATIAQIKQVAERDSNG